MICPGYKDRQGAFSRIQKINLLKCPVGYKAFAIGMSICPYSVINIRKNSVFSVKSLKRKQNEV